MRANSQEHVERCESATTPASQCRCRCGGLCHGRQLVAQGAGREAFEALADNDPRRLLSTDECHSAEREKKQRARREKLDRERRSFVEEVRRRNPVHAEELEDRWFGAAA